MTMNMTFVPSEGLIITLLGGASALVISCCMCVLKSRCTRIKCCGVEIERDVLTGSEINMAQITPPSMQTPV